ncbi:hypothetical protein NIES4073_27990 [Kalymmatonema gypsitolerans NIES-4073]|nr:hypothetical protein NIES4073_27990 [Scytonema sp. NIES-4073]
MSGNEYNGSRFDAVRFDPTPYPSPQARRGECSPSLLAERGVGGEVPSACNEQKIAISPLHP